jgi:hypothetical protein
MQKGGSEGGQRGYIGHTHIRPYMAIPGKPSARPSPKADHRAAISSFLYFERDSHGPGDLPALRDHLSTWGRAAEFLKELLRSDTRMSSKAEKRRLTGEQ